jgi:hypothetical protein
VVVSAAKAFMPDEPMTVPRIAGRVQRAICLRSFSPMAPPTARSFERDEAEIDADGDCRLSA